MRILTKKKVLKSLLLSTAVGISACGGGGSSGSATGRADEMAPSNLENPVRLDSLGVLPASDSNTGSYLLRVSNYSDNKYTLDSVKILDLDSGKESKLVSVVGGLCSLVPSNGSCSLQLAPHTLKSADVKLEVTLKDAKGELTKLYQQVRVSGKLKASNGGIVMLNDVGQIMSEDGNYGISIPVVLGETFDDIRASNGSIICNTAGYLKGSSCTYEVRGKVGKNGAQVSTRLEGIRNGKVVAYSEETTTNVTTGRGAYLLLTHGLAIDTPESTGTVRVYNNGNTAANGIEAAITPDGSVLQLKDDTCSNLVAGDSCNINLSVSGTQNGQAAVGVSYTDAVTTAAHLTSTNVSYTVANAVAGVSFKTESSNLLGAILGGKDRTALVEVKNTSNRILEDIQLSLAPVNSELTLGVVADDAKACTSITGLELAAGASCRVRVTYSPVESREQSSINLVLNGTYTDQHEQNYSIVSAHALNYSASEVNDSTLNWRVIGGGNGAVLTLNDNVDIGRTNWSLVNTLEEDENLPATFTSDVSLVSATLPTQLSVAPMSDMADGSCEAGHILSGQESCNYTVSYGALPVGTIFESAVSMHVDYTLNDHDLRTATEFKVVGTDSIHPQIKVTVKEDASGALGLSGNGISSTPWSFTASSTSNLKLLYTYTNVGINTAYKFNVDAGNLPAGAQITNLGCPYGTITQDLHGGGACTLEVQVPDPRVFNAPNIMGLGAIAVSDIHMGVSYYNESNNTMEHVAQPSGVLRSVTYNRQWGTLTTGTVVWFESATAYTAHIPVDVEVPAGSSLVTYPIKVNVDLPTPIAGVTHTTCEVKQGQTACDKPVEITLPKSLFNTATPLRVAVDAAYAGAPESDVLRLITDLTTETVTSVTLAAPRLSSESAEFVESVKSEGNGTVEITVMNPNTQPVHVVVGDVPAKYTIDAADCTSKAYLGANAGCKLQVNYDGTAETEAGTESSVSIAFNQANISGADAHSQATNLRLLTRPLRVMFATAGTWTGSLSKPAASDIYDWVRHLCNTDKAAPSLYTRNSINFAPVLNLNNAVTTQPAGTRSDVFEVGAVYYTYKANSGSYLAYLGPATYRNTGVGLYERKGNNTNLDRAPGGSNVIWTGFGIYDQGDRTCNYWASNGTEGYYIDLTWAYYYTRDGSNIVRNSCGGAKGLICVAQPSGPLGRTDR